MQGCVSAQQMGVRAKRWRLTHGNGGVDVGSGLERTLAWGTHVGIDTACKVCGSSQPGSGVTSCAEVGGVNQCAHTFVRAHNNSLLQHHLCDLQRALPSPVDTGHAASTASSQGESLVGGKVVMLQTVELHMDSVASSAHAALYLSKHTLASLTEGTQEEQKALTSLLPSEVPHNAAATSNNSNRAAWLVEADMVDVGGVRRRRKGWLIRNKTRQLR